MSSNCLLNRELKKVGNSVARNPISATQEFTSLIGVITQMGIDNILMNSKSKYS